MGAKKSEWWAVDGELHEIGEGVPHRERFAIPRDNLPNRRRKQMREQFMRRTRLVLKDSEHETWCKKYMELYQELRENWERLYWDEGYSKKIAEDRANYDSAEEDDLDFSPYSRRRSSSAEPNKDLGFGESKQGETWERVTQIRDKFEYDRERRMRERGKYHVLMLDYFVYPVIIDWLHKIKNCMVLVKYQWLLDTTTLQILFALLAFAPMNMENNFGQQNWKRPEARTSQGFPRQT
ncbi:unnamed protein product [Triticum turgidum subsp. durum]|uniref:Uncharacterized protein n=1 Tax=Triticum turgidum subsp. durum TaxID=4567 RepID=A0A9R0UXL5_TRITD|nr:unnamed protein product [Triticum turgidum subsp. durum]